MENNPFEPPQANLDTKRFQPGSIVKAVLAGVAVDLGGSYLAGTVLVIVFAALNTTPAMSGDELAGLGEQFSETVTSFDNLWSWSGVLLGLACSYAGGYVCARLAAAKLKPATGILMAIIALISLNSSGDLELGVNLVLCLLTVFVIYLGASHWRRRHGAPPP